MFSRPRRKTLVALGALALGGAALEAQAPSAAPPPRRRKPLPPSLTGGVLRTEADIVTVEISATSSETMPDAAASSPEARWLLEKLQGTVKLSSRFTLSDDVSRQEVLSTDFLLPAGTMVVHKRGDEAFLLADPAQKTYYAMPVPSLMAALEGGTGIVNSQYEVRVDHRDEKKVIAGLECRRSIVHITYASAVPVENDKVFVQRRVEMTVWHTPDIPGSSFIDHVFFQFQADSAIRVKNTLLSELGFPMQVDFVVSREGAKGRRDEPGSFRLLVTEAKAQQLLDPELFKVPPPGYRRLEKNPFLKPR